MISYVSNWIMLSHNNTRESLYWMSFLVLSIVLETGTIIRQRWKLITRTISTSVENPNSITNQAVPSYQTFSILAASKKKLSFEYYTRAMSEFLLHQDTSCLKQIITTSTEIHAVWRKPPWTKSFYISFVIIKMLNQVN